MQIMIIAVAMYTGEWWGINPNFLQLFRWCSLLICVPLLLFTSRTFFESAWRDIRNFRVGMDVPVALGIGIAFAASTLHTIRGTGAVYYDSVAMFTFFLLSARYFEMSARKHTAEASEALLQLQPTIATKLTVEDGIEQQHSVAVGDKVTGGSTESPLIIRVEKIGDNTVLVSIQRMLEQAQTHRPAIAQFTDRIAAYFVSAILFIAAAVALYWWHAGSADWLQITIATLVVTCPCALSLATSTAITAANGSLSRIGLLINTGKALENSGAGYAFCVRQNRHAHHR